MSRLGKRDITIPAGTTVTVAPGEITVKGKSGTLVRSAHPAIRVKVEGNTVNVSPANNSRLAKALWGTYSAHMRNMIAGVNEPFVKKLEVQGIGYRAEMAGKQIKLSVGFSHPVLLTVPAGLTVAVEKNLISVTGCDKEAVGQFAANIRAQKKPEPYKGKGIRYEGEVVRQKQGKKVTA